MGFSFRNAKSHRPVLASESGQGIVEYILVLVVTVGLILGATYQLNSAFKAWASNYFGDYLACLLETGELPNIDGAPGDSGTCNQLFQPFSLANGRPLIPTGGQSTAAKGKTAGGGAGGSRDRQAGVTSVNSSGGRFGSGSLPVPGGPGRASGAGGNQTNTGSTKVSSGSGYGDTNRKLDTGVKDRVDNRFAFENDQEEQQKRSAASVSKSTNSEQQNSKIRMHRKEFKPDDQNGPDSQMTFGDFIKWLIIAAIVIALVMFIGGQMLQIGKSME